jgi:hypothetical protein
VFASDSGDMSKRRTLELTQSGRIGESYDEVPLTKRDSQRKTTVKWRQEETVENKQRISI